MYVDVDGLAEVDLGNGTNYNPAEALNMYFQTGSIVGRSLTQDGDPNSCLLYTSPSPRDRTRSRMPSSA